MFTTSKKFRYLTNQRILGFRQRKMNIRHKRQVERRLKGS